MRAAAGRLVLLYLPTYSPWLNPIEMLWRHVRREATHGECFPTKRALLAAARDFFARHNRQPDKNLLVIGAKATNPVRLYSAVCHAAIRSRRNPRYRAKAGNQAVSAASISSVIERICSSVRTALVSGSSMIAW